jgi:glycerophosphoryl diester phosphodiesterase
VQSLQLEPTELAAAVHIAHDAGLQVVGWCPDEEQSAKLITAGVDCLIVDDVPARVSR